MMGTCLNDCYSINWMMDVQNHTLMGDYTFEDDYNLILKETTMSSVCQYGDLSIKDERMGKLRLQLSRLLLVRRHTPV